MESMKFIKKELCYLWLSIYKHYFPYDEDEYGDDERNWYNGEYWD